MTTRIQGGGFRETLPSVFAFSAVWIGILVLTAPVLTIAMMISGIVPEESHGDVWFFLFTRVPIIAVAGAALAVVTTARVAGPLVRLSRIFNKVKDGDLDQRVSFREKDKHLREIEAAFNGMMDALSERIASGEGPSAGSVGGFESEDESYSTPSA